MDMKLDINLNYSICNNTYIVEFNTLTDIRFQPCEQCHCKLETQKTRKIRHRLDN